MKTQEIENKLAAQINNLYDKYQKRITNLQHQKPKFSEAAVIIGCSMGIGTAIGTLIPGFGNAIGLAVGLGAGVTTVCARTIHQARMNRKLEHADRIDHILLANKRNEKDIQKIFHQAACTIVQERRKVLRHLDQKDVDKATQFLARHTMAALKHTQIHKFKKDEVVKAMADGVKDLRSKQSGSENIQTNHGENYTLNQIAECKFNLR